MVDHVDPRPVLEHQVELVAVESPLLSHDPLAEELHRTIAIASGALDSLPHNGYVVTTIRAVCGETHARAYGAVGATTVVVPMIGLVVALVLFGLF